MSIPALRYLERIEHVPIFQRGLSNTRFKTLHQEARSLHYIAIVQEILNKNGSFLESRYWHRTCSEDSEGFDVSAVYTWTL